jgi:hypothetical protein
MGIRGGGGERRTNEKSVDRALLAGVDEILLVDSRNAARLESVRIHR